ncbi:MAG: GH116 family glycosyl hydrolase, partial [Spirulina sp.]
EEGGKRNPELWGMGLKAAIAIGTILLEHPPANPHLQTPHYPEDLHHLLETYQSWLEAMPVLESENNEGICEYLYGQLLGLLDESDRQTREIALQSLYKTYLLRFREENTENSLSSAINVGTILALSTALLLAGKKEEAMQITEMLVKQIYDNGLQFRTPEILYPPRMFEGSHSLAGMAIWAIYEVFMKMKI